VTWGPPWSSSTGARRGPAAGRSDPPADLGGSGLIDEYECVAHPILVGHGPTLFAGLGERLQLRLVGRQQFRSGAGALRSSPVESRLEGRLPPPTLEDWQGSLMVLLGQHAVSSRL
jgi:hypothetical protein